MGGRCIVGNSDAYEWMQNSDCKSLVQSITEAMNKIPQGNCVTGYQGSHCKDTKNFSFEGMSVRTAHAEGLQVKSKGLLEEIQGGVLSRISKIKIHYKWKSGANTAR